MHNFLDKFKKSSTTLPLHKTMNPHKHWIVMLWVFCGVAMVLIIFSLYLLYSIKNEQVFQVVSTENKPASLLKEKLLDSTLSSLKIKDDKEKELMAHPLVYPDPSFQ